MNSYTRPGVRRHDAAPALRTVAARRGDAAAVESLFRRRSPMNSMTTELEQPMFRPPADNDDVQALWGCECALPFLIPSLQLPAAVGPLQR